MPQFFLNPQNLTALILPVSVEFLLSVGPVVACIGRLRSCAFSSDGSLRFVLCGNPHGLWWEQRGQYLISFTLKGQKWANSLFELISESKVGDGCKDVHGTEISRLIHWPAIKSSVGGGFKECPGFSDKNLMPSVLSFYKDRTFYDQNLRDKTSSE